jgi:hypothetical protein
MSDVIPRRSPCNGVLPHAPPLSLGTFREGSRCSNSSLSNPISDPLPLKRDRTDSHPLSGSSPQHCFGNAGLKASEPCISPASDAYAPSGGSQPDGKGNSHQRRRSEFAVLGGAAADACTAAGNEEAASLPRLLSLFGVLLASHLLPSHAILDDTHACPKRLTTGVFDASNQGAACGGLFRLINMNCCPRLIIKMCLFTFPATF